MKLNKKRLISGALALLVAVAPMSPYNILNDGVIVAEASNSLVEGWYEDSYGINWGYITQEDGTLMIVEVECSEDAYQAIVPATINNTKVTGIGDSVFYRNYKISLIHLNPNIETIGKDAFRDCAYVKQINLFNVKSIGDDAFGGCINLETVKSLPNDTENCLPSTVTKLGRGSFAGCFKLKSLNIKNTNISKLEDEVFKKTPLTTIEFPETLTEIGAYAFSETNIANITIPEKIEKIGEGAFYRVSGVRNIDISSSTITTIHEKTFSFINNYTGGITIPASVTTIEEEAFANSKLQGVTIGDNVSTIKDNAFSGNYIKTVTIPQKVKNLSSTAFVNNSYLTKFVVNANNPYFYAEDGVLYGDMNTLAASLYTMPSGKNITSYDIPAKVNGVDVKKINKGAFQKNKLLTSVNMSNSSIEVIEDIAFDQCTKLQGIALPKTVSDISNTAFKNCTNLSSISVQSENTNYEAINNVLYCKKTKSLFLYPSNKTETTYIIPETVTEIEDNAFNNCSNIEMLIIPNSVTIIKDNAFNSCDSLVIYCNPDSYTRTYVVNKKLDYNSIISDKSTTVTCGNAFYRNGLAVEPEITVELEGTIIDNSDYDISYSNNFNVGLGTVTITGKGKQFGTVTKEFTINPAQITDITLLTDSYLYDGTAKEPEVTVNCGDATLTTNDYEVSYQNNITAGIATVTVTGKGNYTGTITKNFRIAPKAITSIELSDTEYEYDGTAQKPTVTAKYNDEILDKEYYTVEYTNNINAGTASVRVKGKGDYAGDFKEDFLIIPASINEVILDYSEVIYDAIAKTPGVTVKSDELVATTNDYDVIYINNINAGTATATVIGKNNYKGTIEESFTITPAEITDVTLIKNSYEFTGNAIIPEISVTAGGLTLSKSDYEVIYSKNVNTGTASLSVTGKGNYAGTISKSYNITKANITDVILSDLIFEYDGTAKMPRLTVKSNGIIITEGKDYTVEYLNNIKAGKATIKITGTGNYTNIITKEFTIKAKDKAPVNPGNTTTVGLISDLKQKSYSLNSVRIAWSKVSDATGYEIYRATSKNGKYKRVKTTTSNEYKNSKLTAGKTYYYKVRAYKIVNGKKIYGEYSSVEEAKTKAKAPKLRSVSSSKDKISVKWNKVTGAAGYEVYVRKDNGKYTLLKSTSSKTSGLTIKKISKKTKYSFKIKAYRTIGKQKIYSSWSNVKSVKTK